MLPISVTSSKVAARAMQVASQVAELAVALPQRVFDNNRVSRLDPVRALPGVWPLLPPYRVVARRADVVRALDDPTTFPTCYPEDLVGDFVSRLEGKQHEKLAAGLVNVLHDSTRVECLAAAAAEECLAAAASTQMIDVGDGLVHPVINRIINDYVGVTGIRPDELLASARDLFTGIFLNGYSLAPVHASALAAKERLGAHVDELLETAPPDGTLRSALQGQELFHQFSTTAVRDNLIGLAVGWLWHGSRAAIIAVDELLDRPEELARARRAAKAGDLAALRRVLWEVLRFRPVQIGLVRKCAGGAQFADGARIPDGTKVLVATHSAMWDPAVVPDPADFDWTRAATQYLIFGAGTHRCPGQPLVQAQLPAMLAPLLRQDWISRADGRAGRLRWVGASADGFRVLLPAPSALR